MARNTAHDLEPTLFLPLHERILEKFPENINNSKQFVLQAPAALSSKG
jgi:hypothetical protein